MSPAGAGAPAADTRRVFLALPLPHAARQEVAAHCAPLAMEGAALRPVAPAGYHITVHFFGSLACGHLARARELCLDDALASVAPLRCRFSALGQLPPRGAARVVHAVIGEGAAALEDFMMQVRGLVAAAGFAVDRRPPLPHVTVARVRRGMKWTARSTVAWSGVAFLLDRLVLFESLLGRAGARYEPLVSRRLGVS